MHIIAKAAYNHFMGHRLVAESIVQSEGGQEGLGRPLFSDLSFAWEAPELHVIMGPSGSGKSSFLKSIGGVWRPVRGKILLDGRSLWKSNKWEQEPELLQRIGFAFQNNALFNSLRVIENLLLPHRQRFADCPSLERQKTAQNWLEAVGLGHAAMLFPHELSGGMQKRLAIARALVMQPDFVFLDDPTAGLDPITSKQMAELIRSLLKGTEALVVVVTNDPDRARDFGPNIHFLVGGALCSPSHQEYPRLAEEYL